MALRSLRSRLIVGSLVWAGGVMVSAIFIGAAVYHRHPNLGYQLHNGLLTLFAIISVIVGISLFRRGLRPLDALRDRLGAVRDGRDARIGGEYPAEVQPLVDDLNTLLKDREERVTRAVARAGDLAHGLKTPLAVLAQEAERAAAAGQLDLADVIEQQVTRMRRQVDTHLAQARVSASGVATPCDAGAAIDGLIRTLGRLYSARDLEWNNDVAPTVAVRVDRADLEEMLGNLLDNACKWARHRIRLSAAPSGDRVAIYVDDDGPGLPLELRDAVLTRGVRADDSLPGSGWGLAIVHDLAKAYGGAITLDQSPLGGLRAVLVLPA